MIVDDVASALPRLREHAESLMVDACTILRRTGRTEDPDTGVVSDTTQTLYVGKCKVQARDVDVSTPEVGSASLSVLKLRVDVPMSVVAVGPDDLVVITSAAYDPALVGRSFRVSGPFLGTFKTARRLPVEETADAIVLEPPGRLLTETSDTLVTEAGDAITEEAA